MGLLYLTIPYVQCVCSYSHGMTDSVNEQKASIDNSIYFHILLFVEDSRFVHNTHFCLFALIVNVVLEENFETDILLIFQGTLH
jgi:hypothetical protein